MDTIQETWKHLGVKSVRPLRRTVFVRTLPIPQTTESGLLWLPPRAAGFYGEMPHLKLIRGEVLAVGVKCNTKVGEIVVFQRLHFARWKELPTPDTFVGWIDESQLVGYSLD